MVIGVYYYVVKFSFYEVPRKIVNSIFRKKVWKGFDSSQDFLITSYVPFCNVFHQAFPKVQPLKCVQYSGSSFPKISQICLPWLFTNHHMYSREHLTFILMLLFNTL